MFILLIETMPTDPMTLSQFDSWQVSTGFAALLAVIGYFCISFIKGFKKDMDKIAIANEEEKKDRESGDKSLAMLIAEVTKSLNEHKSHCGEKMGDVLPREEFIKSQAAIDLKMDKFHERMDDIYQRLTEMSQNMVTREYCLEQHRS